MKNALVFGGAGFVGRALTKRLLAMDVATCVVDDLSTGLHPHMWLDVPEPAGFSFFKADVRDYCANRSTQYDAVFHCAAIVGGRLVIEGDPLRVATDLAIDSDFFRWCVKAKPKKIVYFSSSAVYPINLQRKGQHCALSETFVDFNASKFGMPDKTYGFAKFAGELLAQYAVKNYNLDVVIYRPFSGYGEDQDPSYPFPAILRRIRNRENPLTIWGSGDQERDFIHIEDVVTAVLKTINVLQPGEALNLGTGFPTSFVQLAQMACNLDGAHGLEIVTDKTKPEGVFSRVCDPYKLHQWYMPMIVLQQGIEMMLDALDRERKVA